MSEEQRPCDARTARQASWGGSGCQRWAVTQVDGHWACKQHAEKPPPNGWNVVPRACERPAASYEHLRFGVSRGGMMPGTARHVRQALSRWAALPWWSAFLADRSIGSDPHAERWRTMER